MKSPQSYNCQMALDHLIAEMNLNKNTSPILDELIHTYPDCEELLREFASTWNDLEQLETPAPSPEMHGKFYSMIKNYESIPTSNGHTFLASRMIRLRIFQYAAAIALLISGVFIGRYLIPRPSTDDLASFQPDDKTQSDIIFTGMSAINRLEQIQNTKNIKNPDKIIFESLNQVLLNDPNINVRLSAIEAMLYFSDYPEVRTYLIQAIPKQNSPIVQIALADAMTALQEKKSLEPIKEMIESGSLELEVKNHYEKTIKEIM